MWGVLGSLGSHSGVSLEISFLPSILGEVTERSVCLLLDTFSCISVMAAYGLLLPHLKVIKKLGPGSHGRRGCKAKLLYDFGSHLTPLSLSLPMKQGQ